MGGRNPGTHVGDNLKVGDSPGAGVIALAVPARQFRRRGAGASGGGERLEAATRLRWRLVVPQQVPCSAPLQPSAQQAGAHARPLAHTRAHTHSREQLLAAGGGHDLDPRVRHAVNLGRVEDGGGVEETQVDHEIKAAGERQRRQAACAGIGGQGGALGRSRAVGKAPRRAAHATISTDRSRPPSRTPLAPLRSGAHESKGKFWKDMGW